MGANGASASKVGSYPVQSPQGLVERALKMHSLVFAIALRKVTAIRMPLIKLQRLSRSETFLGDAARLQAPDVGIRLARKSEDAAIPSAKEHTAELEFLKQLRGKTALLHIVSYENWMSARSHVRLL